MQISQKRGTLSWPASRIIATGGSPFRASISVRDQMKSPLYSRKTLDTCSRERHFHTAYVPIATVTRPDEDKEGAGKYLCEQVGSQLGMDRYRVRWPSKPYHLPSMLDRLCDDNRCYCTPETAVGLPIGRPTRPQILVLGSPATRIAGCIAIMLPWS